MLLRLFNTNHPVAYIYLLIYAIILKGSFFFLPYDYSYETQAFFSNALFDFLGQYPGWSWAYHAFAILIVYLQAVVFNQVLLSYRFMEMQTYIPAMIFITLSSLRPEFILLSPVNIAYAFVIPWFINMMQIPFRPVAIESMFFAAFSLSLASLFYFPVSFLLPFLLLALIVLKNPKGREILISLVGFVLPYFFIGVYYFTIDSLDRYWENLIALFPGRLAMGAADYGAIFLGGFILLLIIAGYFRALRTPQQNVILYRKYLSTFLLFLVVGAAFYFVVSGDKVLYGYMFLIPASIFIGSLFDTSRPGFTLRFLLFLLIVLCAYFQWEYATEMVNDVALP